MTQEGEYLLSMGDAQVINMGSISWVFLFHIEVGRIATQENDRLPVHFHLGFYRAGYGILVYHISLSPGEGFQGRS